MRSGAFTVAILALALSACAVDQPSIVAPNNSNAVAACSTNCASGTSARPVDLSSFDGATYYGTAGGASLVLKFVKDGEQLIVGFYYGGFGTRFKNAQDRMPGMDQDLGLVATVHPLADGKIHIEFTTSSGASAYFLDSDDRQMKGVATNRGKTYQVELTRKI
jgi:hypothetical protein